MKADTTKWFSPEGLSHSCSHMVRVKSPEDFFIFVSGVWAELAGTSGGPPGFSILLSPHGLFGLPHSMAISGKSDLTYGGWLSPEPVFSEKQTKAKQLLMTTS